MSFSAKLALALTVFLLGFSFSTILSSAEVRYPFSYDDNPVISPTQKISASDISVFADRAVIYKQNLHWARIEDTHSMEPVLNSNSFSLELMPASESEISIGDILSFQSNGIVIIHRVIETGSDELGWYAVTKGDNNPANDPEKVRFGQVKGIVAGILY